MGWGRGRRRGWRPGVGHRRCRRPMYHLPWALYPRATLAALGPWPLGLWPLGFWPLGPWPLGLWPLGLWPLGLWPLVGFLGSLPRLDRGERRRARRERRRRRRRRRGLNCGRGTRGEAKGAALTPDRERGGWRCVRVCMVAYARVSMCMRMACRRYVRAGPETFQPRTLSSSHPLILSSSHPLTLTLIIVRRKLAESLTCLVLGHRQPPPTL